MKSLATALFCAAIWFNVSSNSNAQMGGSCDAEVRARCQGGCPGTIVKKILEECMVHGPSSMGPVQQNPFAVPQTPDAMFQAARTLFFQQNYLQSLAMFTTAAQLGNPDSAYFLGQQYERGLGVTKDDNVAMEWYRRAADQDFSAGQFKMGMAYEVGMGGINFDIIESLFKMLSSKRQAVGQDKLSTTGAFAKPLHICFIMYKVKIKVQLRYESCGVGEIAEITVTVY